MAAVSLKTLHVLLTVACTAIFLAPTGSAQLPLLPQPQPQPPLPHLPPLPPVPQLPRPPLPPVPQLPKPPLPPGLPIPQLPKPSLPPGLPIPQLPKPSLPPLFPGQQPGAPGGKECWESLKFMEGCAAEIQEGFKSGHIGVIGPTCCKAASVIMDKCWPKTAPSGPILPSLVNLYCAKYAGPAPAPTA